MKLSWQTWLYGLVSGVIGGGAHAVIAGVAVSVAHPELATLKDQFQIMGVVFLISGALAAFTYLSKSPLPEVVPDTTTTTVGVTTQPGAQPKTTTTVSETHTETKP
jgi:hypothetical protein